MIEFGARAIVVHLRCTPLSKKPSEFSLWKRPHYCTVAYIYIKPSSGIEVA
jgi:hypothetical protein